MALKNNTNDNSKIISSQVPICGPCQNTLTVCSLVSIPERFTFIDGSEIGVLVDPSTISCFVDQCEVSCIVENCGITIPVTEQINRLNLTGSIGYSLSIPVTDTTCGLEGTFGHINQATVGTQESQGAPLNPLTICVSTEPITCPSECLLDTNNPPTAVGQIVDLSNCPINCPSTDQFNTFPLILVSITFTFRDDLCS